RSRESGVELADQIVESRAASLREEVGLVPRWRASRVQATDVGRQRSGYLNVGGSEGLLPQHTATVRTPGHDDARLARIARAGGGGWSSNGDGDADRDCGQRPQGCDQAAQGHLPKRDRADSRVAERNVGTVGIPQPVLVATTSQREHVTEGRLSGSEGE